jgi:D-serine dehydratase
VDDAHARLNRFAPYLAKAFRKRPQGIIESELVVPAMQARLEKELAFPARCC